MYEAALGSQFCSKGINFCRESIFLLLQKQPDQLGTIFSLLYWWRNCECVSHLPKDTQLRRCGPSPSLPGSPASLPTKLSSHQILCSQGQILLHHFSRRESSEEQRDWPNASSLVRWQSWIDLTLLTLCLSVAAFPSITSLRPVREVSVYAQVWGIWTLRPSVLTFRSQDYITFQNICSRGDGCEFFFFS